ncbi:hypothetical protein GY45DRAFT_1253908 [Cubamyces sp. BRFM 1775]|nr:hypothetical protein GY45DRAFT_1253908 [Cubamyces sp. BRFM 1775]
MFAILDAANMSTDETDSSVKKHSPVFCIVVASWQSQALKNFLWALDAMYCAEWEKPCHRHAMAGNAPRVRILPLDSEGSSEVGVAPVGLPRNFYDVDWLASLPEYARRDLETMDEDYDFSL